MCIRDRVEGQLQHFDLFALGFQAAACVLLVFIEVLADEKMHPFSHRTRAHEGFEHLAHVLDDIAGFLLGFLANAGVRVVVVQQAGAGFDQQVIVPVDEGREAELPGQHHGLLGFAVQQDGGAIATVVGLARQLAPLAIAAEVVIGGLAQHVPIIREDFDVLDADAIFGGGYLCHHPLHSWYSSGRLAEAGSITPARR
ncbi:hypothetical protein D3C78_960480 [compost metagenome]